MVVDGAQEVSDGGGTENERSLTNKTDKREAITTTGRTFFFLAFLFFFFYLHARTARTDGTLDTHF